MGDQATTLQAPAGGFRAALTGYTTKQFLAAIPPEGEVPSVPIRVRIAGENGVQSRLIVIDAARLAATEGGAA